MAETSLAKIEKAHRALASAKTVDVVKGIRDQYDALRVAARIARNRNAELDCAEIRFRAERRLGQMIAGQKKTVGLARPGRRKIGSAPDPNKPTLSQAGIDKHLADRARELARMSDEHFEQNISFWRNLNAGGKDAVSVNFWRATQRTKARVVRKPRDLRHTLPFVPDDDAIDESPLYQPPALYGEQQLQRWLKENLSAPPGSGIPPRFDSVAKVVAWAMWKLELLTDCYTDNARDFVEIFETMWTRINKIVKAHEAVSGKQSSGKSSDEAA